MEGRTQESGQLSAGTNTRDLDLRRHLGKDVFDGEAAWLGRLVEKEGGFFAERGWLRPRRIRVEGRDVLFEGRQALFLELPANCYRHRWSPVPSHTAPTRAPWRQPLHPLAR